MDYAIVEMSGKQIWIEKGKFYDINKINSTNLKNRRRVSSRYIIVYIIQYILYNIS
mgnify:CR=1 FL=1